MAIQHAWSRNYGKVIIESDCKKAMDMLNRKVLHFDGYNWTREILWWRRQMEEVQFVWTNRDSNQVADKLAKQRINGDVSFLYHNYVP